MSMKELKVLAKERGFTTYNNLSKEVKNNFSGAGDSFAKVGEDLNQLIDEIDATKADVEAAKNKTEDLDKDVKKIDADVKKVEKDTKNLKEDIKGTEKKINEMKETMDDLSGKGLNDIRINIQAVKDEVEERNLRIGDRCLFQSLDDEEKQIVFF